MNETKQYTGRDPLVTAAAAYFVRNEERPTVVEVARYAEGFRLVRLTSMSDTAFSRFVARVQREVAMILQEQEDTNRALGR